MSMFTERLKKMARDPEFAKEVNKNVATLTADEASEAEGRAAVAQAKAAAAKKLADQTADNAKSAASAAPAEPPAGMTEEEKAQWRKDHAGSVDSEMQKNLVEAGFVNPDPPPPTAAEKKAAEKAEADKAAAKAEADKVAAQAPMTAEQKAAAFDKAAADKAEADRLAAQRANH